MLGASKLEEMTSHSMTSPSTSLVRSASERLTTTSLSVQLSGGEAESLSKMRSEWDQKADEADQRQTELFHMQWSLFREQIATFSRELIILRKVVQKMQEESAAERQTVHQSTAEIRSLLEISKDHTEELSRRIETEARERAHGDAAGERRLAEVEENLRKQTVQMLGEEAAERRKEDQDLVHKLQILSEQFQSETTTTRSQMEELRAHIARVEASLESEKARNHQFHDELRASVAALDKENGSRKHETDRLTGDLKQTGTDLGELHTALEHERDTRQGRLQALRDELFAETRRSDGCVDKIREDLTKTSQELSLNLKHAGGEQSDNLGKLRAELLKEIQERKADTAQAAQGFAHCKEDLEQERKQRMAADDECRAQVQAIFDELEAEKKARGQAEAQLLQTVNTADADLAGQVKSLKADLDNEAKIRKQEDDKGVAARTLLEQQVAANKQLIIEKMAEEERLRQEQDELFAAELNAAHGNHKDEMARRTKHLNDLTNAFKAVTDSTAFEAKRAPVAKPKPEGPGTPAGAMTRTMATTFSR